MLNLAQFNSIIHGFWAHPNLRLQPVCAGLAVVSNEHTRLTRLYFVYVQQPAGRI